MSKKDYIALATVMRARIDFEGSSTDAADVVRAVAVDLADTLAADNPRFNRNTFLQACNAEGEV
jgi:hypothetical protein